MSDNDEYSLTSKAWRQRRTLMDQIMKMTGMDKIAVAVKEKFNSKEWVLIERGRKEVEVYSVGDAETVSVLDEEMLEAAYDKDGKLFPVDDALCLWLALRLVSARDGKDNELTPEGIAIRKWLKSLDVDSDVIDGTCTDKYLGDEAE